MPMLQEMMERALDRWDRVRRYFFSGVLVHRAEQAQREHHALLDAMQAARPTTGSRTTIRAAQPGALAAYTAYLERDPGDRKSFSQSVRDLRNVSQSISYISA